MQNFADGLAINGITKDSQNLTFRDGLATGLKSDAIRVRLMELVDLEALLDKCISFANAIKVYCNFSQPYNATSDTSPFTSSAPVGNIAAVNKKAAHSKKASKCKCRCKRFKMSRNKYTARRSKCLKFENKGTEQQTVSHLLQILLRMTTNT